MFTLQEPWILPLILFAVLVAVALLCYRRTNPRLSAGLKAILVSLRVLAVLLLVIVLVRPLLVYDRTMRQGPEVAVLIDHSASMKLKDARFSRLEVLDSLLKSPVWEKLAESASLRFYSFSDSLIPGKQAIQPQNFSGIKTDIGTSLQELNEENRYLNAAILISDGGNNSGPDPAEVSSGFDFPVYSIGIGSQIPPLDISISGLDYPRQVFLGSPARIEIEISGLGEISQKLELALSEGNKILEKKQISVTGGGKKQSVSLELKPQEIGVHNYQIRLPQLQGEINHSNNQRRFSLRVDKSRQKVLLGGVAGWEYHFLKLLLETQKQLEVTQVVSDGIKILQGRFPQNSNQLNEFDLAIMVSPTPAFLAGKEKILDDFVISQGKSVLFVMDDNFTRPAASRLQMEVLPFNPGAVRAVYQELSLVPDWPEQKLFLLESADNGFTGWNRLPPFLGTLLPAQLKDQAQVFATAAGQDTSNALPAVLAQEFQRGKVLTTLCFPFWRWEFVSLGLDLKGDAYAQFWGNVLNWLIVPADRENFQITPDKLVYEGGESINFKSRFLGEFGKEVTGGRVVLHIENTGNREKSELELYSSQEGEYAGSLNFLPPGNYRVNGTYLSGDRTLATAKSEFQVEEYSLEDQTLIQNRQLLTQIAERTGGKYLTTADLAELPEDLPLSDRIISEHKEFEIWNQTMIMIAGLFCLGLEWLIRKRHQLP